MKFAHLADCHIGGWREERLTKLGLKSFEYAIKECIKRKVEFILISGDLFNTALPGIDYVKEVVTLLRIAKENGIRIYTIAGSHDYSMSGKTMLDVLENAGLVVNVAKLDGNKLKFSIDKSGAKITGLYGKKGGLERFDYREIDRNALEREQGFKIFMFHSGVKEFMPEALEDVDSLPFNMLPGGFNYYAGGHIHYIFHRVTDGGMLAFPGALFPNNFKEIEEFRNGGFYIVNGDLSYEHVAVKVKDVLSIIVDANKKSIDDIEKEILSYADQADDKIVTIRVEGILKIGRPSELNLKRITERFSNAYCVIKNTSKLVSEEHVIMEVSGDNVGDIEKDTIVKNADQLSAFGDYTNKVGFFNDLMDAINLEKQEGEKSHVFEERVISNALKLFFSEKDDNK